MLNMTGNRDHLSVGSSKESEAKKLNFPSTTIGVLKSSLKQDLDRGVFNDVGVG